MSYKNIPRLFINKVLKENIEIDLNVKDRHYLKNVLRLSEMSKIKVFNGKDGEWEALISSRDCNKIKCFKKIKKQVFEDGANLYFSIIKSHNLRWLLEKSTELGVKNLYPMITDRVNVRNFNYEKANLYLKEASEVSERLELPKLHNIIKFTEILMTFKINQKILFFVMSPEKIFIYQLILKKTFQKIFLLL